MKWIKFAPKWFVSVDEELADDVTEVLHPTREYIDGAWRYVHSSADGKLSVSFGPDDQRPDHDGQTFFRPFCVAHLMSDAMTVYSYDKYCGACRKRLGTVTHEFCPRCGVGIAHYIFAMGLLGYAPTFSPYEGMPEELPFRRRTQRALPSIQDEAAHVLDGETVRASVRRAIGTDD